MSDPRPVAILLAAMGGEGGGVLTGWLVDAARRAGLLAQSTSIPGVAQRTGATTYYVELFPAGGRQPVLDLHPSPGAVDLAVATELLEIGRLLEGGYVTPSRTVLIGATQRSYAVVEKAHMEDGRFPTAGILAAAARLAARAVLFDLSGDPERRSMALNAVVLGVIAGADVLPIGREAFVAAISAKGVLVAPNVAAFDAGVALARDGVPAVARPRLDDRQASALPDRSGAFAELAGLPDAVLPIAEAGFHRLALYQDRAYAKLYAARLWRLQDVLNGGQALIEAARRLALWMAYEDIVRVAQLKTSRERLAEVRAETRAKPGEPVRITDFFKPGVEEVAACLPRRPGRALLALARRRGAVERWRVPMPVRTTTVLGFLMVRLLAGLRFTRRWSLRFHEEQELIERWIGWMRSSGALGPAFAVSLAALPGLLKGYGDTNARGRANFERIAAAIVVPATESGVADAGLLEAAIAAALADPSGATLTRTLDEPQRLAA